MLTPSACLSLALAHNGYRAQALDLAPGTRRAQELKGAFVAVHGDQRVWPSLASHSFLRCTMAWIRCAPSGLPCWQGLFKTSEVTISSRSIVAEPAECWRRCRTLPDSCSPLSKCREACHGFEHSTSIRHGFKRKRQAGTPKAFNPTQQSCLRFNRVPQA